MARPPEALIAAFRATETPEQLGVMVAADGFDPEIVRVLAAFMSADVDWSEPPMRCPDGGRPTARAWAWTWSGCRVDYMAIATAAGLSRLAAREKLAALIGARLIYADGSISKHAQAALQSAIAKNARRKKKKDAAAEVN